MKTFKYLGKSFTPVRQFNKKENDLGISLPLRSIGISNYDDMHNSISSKWNYDEFYTKAKNIGAGEIDIFEMNGKLVVPGSNELFEYNANSKLLQQGRTKQIF